MPTRLAWIWMLILPLLVAGCQKVKLTETSRSSIENTCTTAKECCQLRDYSTFYDLLHPEIQRTITRKKFSLGMRTHSRFVRLVREATLARTAAEGDTGTAWIDYQGGEYDIAFRRHGEHWLFDMQEGDVLELEERIQAAKDAANANR